MILAAALLQGATHERNRGEAEEVLLARPKQHMQVVQLGAAYM